METVTHENTKRNRFYYLHTMPDEFMIDDILDNTLKKIVWVSNSMVGFWDGWSLNKEMYFEDSDMFTEIGFDCPYNHLIRKCLFSNHPVSKVSIFQKN